MNTRVVVLHYQAAQEKDLLRLSVVIGQSRKCSECGVWATRWTDKRSLWESPPEGYVNCKPEST